MGGENPKPYTHRSTTRGLHMILSKYFVIKLHVYPLYVLTAALQNDLWEAEVGKNDGRLRVR